MLALFEVIRVYDRTIDPQNLKMFVCIDFTEGWFLRINSRNQWRPCVPLSRAAHHWLDHDSFVECTFLMVDEFEIEESVRKYGIVGRVSLELRAEVLGHLLAAPYIRNDDKRRLAEILA